MEPTPIPQTPAHGVPPDDMPAAPARAEPAALSDRDLQAAAQRRLHPLSWLFILLRQLRAFALPLIVVLISGTRNPDDDWQFLAGAIGAAVLVIGALWDYVVYRYGFLDHALVIRSGVLQRKLRLIPFERIQNVTLHQTLLHRLARVAEVRLESAGGMGKPEAEMRVLRLGDAQALERRLRADRADRTRAGSAAQGAVSAPAGDDAHDRDDADATDAVWLRLPTAELVRYGLISNRGMLLVLAGFGLLSQGADSAFDALYDTVYDRAEAVALDGARLADQLHLGAVYMVVAGALLLAALVVALRLLSVAVAILHYHGFRLQAGARELRVERGLLSRLRMQLPRHRIQAFALEESLLHRWFGRQNLRVDRATLEQANDQKSMRELVPIATPKTMARILGELLPGGHWPLQGWQPLHPRAWRRKFLLPALLTVLVCAAYAVAQSPVALAGLLLVPVWYLRAKVWARYSGWTLDAGVIAWRQGWLDRHWRFAEVRRLQTLRLVQSPFDRRYGMATLWLDTIGASPLEPPLRIPYLDLAVAAALLERLRAQMPRETSTAAEAEAPAQA